ncbi:5-formyltetrahydrofolate cyclo-ligase [Gemella cuniculi]|uniref:5-formyltetrahydrofolate cyclo-ligase n=1 Tax=Gemella cuniculi TaxID=150240 RepID=UPI0004131550|nr:5-formyltetrahydrofolate cyclo-ligase [Gemella cuniculi]
MKKELRKYFLEQRNNLNKNYTLSAEKNIFKILERNIFFKTAQSIFIYINFGSEITTENFIKKYINKKKIFVPKIVDNDMELVKISSWEELSIGNFGILEPKKNDFYKGSIDLVITPSIVFDKNGYRLGYGKGYYDKYFDKNNYKISIGLSYEKLLQKNLPTFAHDKSVDILITEEKVRIINEKYSNNN